MADIPQIVASLATPSLSSALQQAQDLPLGQAVEAKITQILSDGLIRLSASFGSFELKASHPSLQPGATVRLDISESGNVTLTLLPQKTAAPAQLSLPIQPRSPSPAVITTLSAGQSPQAPPVIYSATGQTVQPGQVSPSPGLPASLQAPVSGQTATALASEVPAAVSPQTAFTKAPNVVEGQTPAPSQIGIAPPVLSAPALSAALHDALTKQNSLAPLIANLDSLSRQAKPLPQSLQAAIEDVLQTIQPLSEDATSQNLQQAVKKSGVFFENGLSQNGLQQETPAAPLADLKGALLKLVAVLSTLQPGQEPVAQKQLAGGLPPPAAPHGHDTPEVQRQRPASLTPYATQQEITEVLSSQAESALSRVRVLQFASMPAASQPQDAQRPAQIWHFDIPLLINGQGSVIPLQIERDAEKKSAAAAEERRWRVRFAIDLGALGPVHALLALGAGMVDVTLWAERAETYDMFKAKARDLHYALMVEDLEVAEIEFRTGSPRKAAAPAGSHLDTRT